MAISVVGTAHFASSTGTDTPVISLPASQENDVVYVLLANPNGTDPTFVEPGGTWTKIVDLFANDGPDTNLALFRKVMGATPDTSVTINQESGNNYSSTVIVFRGVDTATPEDGHSTDTGINGGTPNPPSFTTLSDNSVVVAFVASSNPDTGAAAPAGYTLQTASFSTVANTACAIATKLIATPALEDPDSFSWSAGTAGDSWCAVTLALKPAASGPIAATFDGTNDWLSRSAELSGAADSPLLLGSFWFRTSSAFSTRQEILSASSTNTSIYVEATTGKLVLALTDGSNVLFVKTDDAVLNDGNWHNYLLGVKTNAASGSRTAQIYLDDSAAPRTPTEVGASFDMDFTSASWTIGSAASGSNKYSGDLAEVYFAFGQYVDLSVTANRRKFIDALGKPVDLASDGSGPTGAAPTIYLSIRDAQTAGEFATNRGSGGDFTVNGSLDTATFLAFSTPTAVTAAVGVAAETNTAQALGHSKARTPGIALSTDAAQAIGRVKKKAISFAASLEAAQAISFSRGASIGTAVSSDAAQAISHSKALAIGVATETSAAQSISAALVHLAHAASENDDAQAIGRKKSKAVGTASAAGTAQAISASRVYVIGTASGTDSAVALSHSKSISIGIAVENSFSVRVAPPSTPPLSISSDQIITTYTPKPLPQIGKPFDATTKYLLDEMKRMQATINQLSQAAITACKDEPKSPRRGMVKQVVKPWNPIGNGFDGLVTYDGTSWVVAAPQYEEGSFVPELSFGGATTGIAYLSRDARYTRIGDRVFYDIRLRLTSKGSATGSVVIGTLPFALAGNALMQVRLSAAAAGIGDTEVCVIGGTPTTTLGLQKVVAGSYANITDADLTNTSDILIVGMVRI